MILVDHQISRDELKKLAAASFGSLVKAVVDVNKEIMALDAPMHADEESYLLSKGSKQSDLWGINLYPDFTDENFIEFDSMINICPGRNHSRGVDDEQTRILISEIVNKLVK